MKERAFKAHPYEVRAMLAGKQTQFRRVVKYPCYFTGDRVHPAVQQIVHRKNGWFGFEAPEHVKQQYISTFPLHTIRCPFGQPEDRLWVRETWMPFGLKGADYLDPRVVIGYKASNDVRPDGVSHEDFGASKEFACTAEQWREFQDDIKRMEVEGDRWRPSPHMRRWASRITLEVTGIRVERLQEISESDAKAEGVEKLPPNKFRNYLGKEYGQGINLNYAAESYRTLWDSINAERGYGWSTDPYVWVIEFRRVESEVAA